MARLKQGDRDPIRRETQFTSMRENIWSRLFQSLCICRWPLWAKLVYYHALTYVVGGRALGCELHAQKVKIDVTSRPCRAFLIHR